MDWRAALYRCTDLITFLHPTRGGSTNYSGGGGVLGRNSSRGGGVGSSKSQVRGNFYTDKQKYLGG